MASDLDLKFARVSQDEVSRSTVLSHSGCVGTDTENCKAKFRAAWARVRVELIGTDVAEACQTPKPSQASPRGILQIAPGIELRTSRIR